MAFLAIETLIIPEGCFRWTQSDFSNLRWWLALTSSCIVSLICITGFYLLAFVCLIIPKLIRFTVMSRLNTAFRKCIPWSVRRTGFTFLSCIVVPRCLLRTFSTNELVLVPKRSIGRAESWSSCARCWNWWISSRSNGLRRICRLRRGGFTFFSIYIVGWSLRALNRIIIGFAITSQCKSIPDFVLSAWSTTSNIYVIKRMLFRTNLATHSLVTPDRLILRTSRGSSQIDLAFWCFSTEKLTYRASSIYITVMYFRI